MHLKLVMVDFFMPQEIKDDLVINPSNDSI